MYLMSWKYVQRNDETGAYRTVNAPNLVDLGDIDIDNLQDGQIIKWDAQNQKFVNANESNGQS